MLQLKLAGTSDGRVPIVDVCIDRKGPYPFVVSTGAGSSAITPALARSLHLRRGNSTAIRGVTCVNSAPSVKVKTWSMSGARLAAQRVLVAKVGVPRAKGVIGSDVLMRFGAVRIDYHTKHLLLAGGEGPAPAGNVYVLGQKSPAPPSPLAKGTLKASAPLRVFESPQGTIVAAPVKFSGHTEQLAVDSGSADSGLLPALARSLKLKTAGANLGVSGLGCSGKAHTYVAGSWSLGGTVLPSDGSVVARFIAGGVNSGLQGVLGSDVLAAQGSVIVDYSGAHLWLATG